VIFFVGLWEWGWTAGKVLDHKHIMTLRVCETLLPWWPLSPCSLLRHVQNQHLSMDRPQQLRIGQKITIYLSPGI